MISWKQNPICQIFHKKIQNVLMKIDKMADVFLNLSNFASHAFLTLAPPSGHALNLKTLIRMSKVTWTSQLSYEILRSSLERKFDKTNFISPKSTPSKSPGLLGLNSVWLWLDYATLGFLVIIIPSLSMFWVSTDTKKCKELESVALVHCFAAKMYQSNKNLHS